jgi:Mycothiol maleylpyruvate isomerase N-terminal domain.
MDTLPGAIGLLAGAVSYMLGVCAPLGPEEMALPTPCPHWDLARLLSHLCESMADLEAALRTGRLDLDGPPGRTGGDPVEALRDAPPSCCAPATATAARSASWRWAPADPGRPGRLHRGGGDRGARLGRLGGPRPGWPRQRWQ